MLPASRGRGRIQLIDPNTTVPVPGGWETEGHPSSMMSNPEHPGGVRAGYSWGHGTPVRSGGVNTHLTELKPGNLEVPREPLLMDGAKAAARHTGALQRGATSLIEEGAHGELDGEYVEMEDHRKIPTDVSVRNGVYVYVGR